MQNKTQKDIMQNKNAVTICKIKILKHYVRQNSRTLFRIKTMEYYVEKKLATKYIMKNTNSRNYVE